MSNHTPGPWKLDQSDGEVIYGTDRYGENQVVVYELNTNAADKKLILAAPDLLQALIDLGDWLAYGMNKADGAEPTAEDHAACERVAAAARAAIDKATA